MIKITSLICIFLLIIHSNLLIARKTFPITKGFLVFHVYSNYEAWDGKLYLFNFSNQTLEELSEGWNIDHSINGHISPDGTKLAFMGDDSGEPRDWDIYLWEIDSDEHPVNLTHVYDNRDEDPKFSPDGNKIVFKQRYWDDESGSFKYAIKEMDLTGSIINTITPDNNIEESMPYYTSDGQQVIYAINDSENSDIYYSDINSSIMLPLVNEPNIQEYYPITYNSETFLYARWLSASDHHDQIFLGYFSGESEISLAINNQDADNSDPYPVSSEYIFFSSTRNGGSGGYDLYLGNINTGEVTTLNNLGVNSSKEELGACYSDIEINKINEIDVNMSPYIYPNPSSNGVFQINIKSDLYIEVININGGKILSDKLEIGTNLVDLTNFSNGIYFIKCFSKFVDETQKVLICR